MSLLRLRATLIGSLFALSSFATSVNYTISFPQPQTHYAEVEMQIVDWKGGPLDLRMPVWAPGSYMVRDFSRFVESVSAIDAKGNNLKYTRSAKNGWKFNAPSGNVTIKYSVYAYELTVRTSFIDADHAFLNGTSIFLYAEGGKAWPITVKVNPHTSWSRTSVALESVGVNTYAAADYDLLSDSPLEIGNHPVFGFTASGVQHEVAMFGEGNYDTLRLQKDMKRIVEECTSIFGSHPCKKYLFIIHNLSSGGGGLEHLNSTTLQTGRFSYSNESSYTGFLSLVAHEYFHLWNVKRLRPAELGPFDYNNENHTNLLWFSEGFTAYYDDLIVRRCGFTSPENYLSTLAGNFSYVTNTPGSKVQSLEESSYDAWIKFYRPHENSANNSVSYYTKGAAAGAIMDLSIRQATAGRKSLDDVMKQLYQKYYLDNNGKKGFTSGDFIAMLNQISGKSQDALYNQLITGTDSISFGNYLSVAGLQIADLNSKSSAAWVGIGSSFKENKLTISTVERNGPGWKSGLNVNDEIIAVNKLRAGDDLSKLLLNYKAGNSVTFTIARGGVLREIPVTLATSPAVKFSITPATDASQSSKDTYNNWLRVK